MLKRILKQQPILVINIKAYHESTGKNALKIALAAEKAAKETGKAIALCVQTTDIRMIASKVNIPILAQHIDEYEPGAHTGSTTAEAIIEAGAVGTLINHSEKQLPEETIEKIMKQTNKYGLFSIICVKTPKEAAELSLLDPNYIAIEPPELIGTGKSISTAEPKVIDKTIKLVTQVSKTPVICGAGVSNKKDVQESIKHGVKGVLLASAVAKHPNPYEKIMELLEGM
ncbi:triose-phosphate isomerase [Candidatus Woesearchaeota archaeon]|nr:triose-phosphate isomerase [Candidatus Woesearchaeota archaeon]MCF7901461.1 triose-phosphate isomerase [Candidatus Woesearchaeota archaeon]MCF8013546.1 triose-phosphate isomerase [Candidatus Woesearchaeota archaeon]